MALLHADGYEGYGVNAATTNTAAVAALFNNEYIGQFSIGGGASANLVITTGVSYGFFLDWVTGTTSNSLRKIVTPGSTTIIVGFKLFINSDRAVTNTVATIGLIRFWSAGLHQCAFSIDGTGIVGFHLGAASARTTSSAAGVWPINTWAHFEIKITIADAGSYEVRLNGVNVFSASTDTQGQATTGIDGVEIFGYKFRIDDYYILDSTGSANNDFLGLNTVVKTIYPNADSAVAWTRSTGGTNFSLVDENGSNGDTDYVDTATATQKDLYDLESITGISTVNGIQVRTICRATGSQSHSLEIPIKSGATESAGSATVINTSTFSSVSRIMETDPASGVAFTPTDINSLIVGVKKT